MSITEVSLQKGMVFNMDFRMNGSRTANVLIVDDVASNLVVLTEIIKQAGYVPRPVTSAKQAMDAMKISLPQLILLDISMPDMDGFEFCEILKKETWTKDIPIIFISALDASEDKKRAFELGAVDFIVKPFEKIEVISRVNTHIKLFKLQQTLEDNNKRLYKMVTDQIKLIQNEKKNMIYALAKLSESRDNAMGDHIKNIGKNCKLLAQSLQFSPVFEKEISQTFIDTIEIASAIHDIGKIKIPDRILLKPGKLTDEEMEIMKTHTELGAKSLMDIYASTEHNDFIKMAIDIAYYHHEKWDGTGYPNGLSGKSIPLSARIMSIVDVYDTLTGERCYKQAFSHEESMKIINDNSGTSFDPDIIEIFNKIQHQLRRE